MARNKTSTLKGSVVYQQGLFSLSLNLFLRGEKRHNAVLIGGYRCALMSTSVCYDSTISAGVARNLKLYFTLIKMREGTSGVSLSVCLELL